MTTDTKSKKILHMMRKKELHTFADGVTTREIARKLLEYGVIVPSERTVKNTYQLLDYLRRRGRVTARKGKEEEAPAMRSGNFYVWSLTDAGRKYLEYIKELES